MGRSGGKGGGGENAARGLEFTGMLAAVVGRVRR
jgi:hypothetical protein